VALLLEAGLLLVLIPWSAFWDRNYFVEAAGSLGGLLTSNYTRGAVSGLGLINVWAALAELGDLFGSGRSGNPPSEIEPTSEIRDPR
jgi:hypothetical protein